MTSPAPSGGSSPMRIGGIALVGVAVVAALVGVLTLATGGGSTDEALAPAASTSDVAAPPAVDPAAPPAPDPNAPPPAAAAAPTPAPAVPGASPAPGAPAAPTAPTGPTAPSDEPIAPYTPPAGAGGSDSAKGSDSARAPLRVYNNSRIKGLAEEAAADFRSAGWDVDSVGNYSNGVIPTSTVYYQPGEEDAAEALGNEFGLRVAPRFAGLETASEGLIVIVTREYGN